MMDMEPHETEYPLLVLLEDVEDYLSNILIRGIDPPFDLPLSMHGAHTLARNAIEHIHDHLVYLVERGA